MRHRYPVDPSSDAEAVLRVRAGNSAEYEKLFNRHYERLRRQALSRVHDPYLAEDMVQEAFLRSFRNLDQLKEPTKYLHWLHRIVDNLCRMHYRRATSRPVVSFPLAGDVSKGMNHLSESPDAAFSRKELRQVVYEVCISLPPSLRATALLSYIDGLSCKQISHSLAIRPEAVDRRLYKVRAWIRRLVSGDRPMSQATLSDRFVTLVKEIYFMDAVRIEISQDLIALTRVHDPETNLLQIIRHLRQELELDHSVHLPRVHVIDNLELAPKSYCILLREQRVSDGYIDDLNDLSGFSRHLVQTILKYRNGLSTNGEIETLAGSLS